MSAIHNGPQLLVDSSSPYLCCPLTKALFENAQILNCKEHHTINLEPAQKIFGKMLDTGVCEKQELCPLCQTRVTAYFPNKALQNLVNAIMFPEMMAAPSDEKKIDYSLKSSSFHHIESRSRRSIFIQAKEGDPLTNFFLTRDEGEKKYSISSKEGYNKKHKDSNRSIF